ncbi:bifunctional protein-serine/threonine kinase/phosphatase [Marinobacter halodurans]|uniref:Bifunctional protein-serine/threonine kinase/phosphatase n=1 Tax=Marinobacter halodurans TaxID=2528979 RepID=A0ABY1ZHR2_9GAMM|nr:bifunctional protein-serine/threonine kinase/phosphatase [Marinobacter halodurans]TBW49987.1 bifunctional protein-serine/threonine kinase/phosphatase [Marinobacter halodurans]
MSGRLMLRLGQFSSAGRKPENQDSLGARYPEGETLLLKGVAAVIADGVSASRAGREAAQACVTGFLHDYYSTPDSWAVETSASRVLGALNRWLHGRGHASHGGAGGMICTFSGLVIKNSRAYVFHVGDSRVYLLRGGDLECLTQDHHVVVSGDRQALSRAMGVEVNVEIDVARVALEPGDRLILTTDGVHGYLSAAELREGAGVEDPETAAEWLVTHALENASPDNLSAQVVAVDHLPSQDLEAHYERLSALPFPPPLQPGQSLDGYRIIRELHSSRRTQVYLASPDNGQPLVAMKTPSPNYVDDPAYIDRFMTESWVARRVSNPHVVRFLEPPENRQCLYCLTEYVDGPTLRAWMNDHPHPEPAEVRGIIRQVAAGVRALHRLEMIHQDLKPENIVIDGDGTAKIIDLGSVRIRGIEQIDVPWDGDGYHGTESYAAPECLEGGRATPASDRYSLGVIAYEMFTGRLPYARSPKPSARARLRYRSAREANPDLPQWLDACLEKAVALRPQDRYPALSEFLQDLEHPNPQLLPSDNPPLMDRVPTENWPVIAITSLLVNAALLLWILVNHH